MAMTHRLVSVAAAAAHLGITAGALRSRIVRGTLPPHLVIRLGNRSIRIDADALDKWVEEGRQSEKES